MSDLIDRNDLFAALNKTHQKAMAGFDWVRVNEVMQAIVDAPTVEIPRWISVKERLPEPCGGENEYLVTVQNDYTTDALWNGIGKEWYYEFNGEFRTIHEVTAWMPLPEPYREESE